MKNQVIETITSASGFYLGDMRDHLTPAQKMRLRAASNAHVSKIRDKNTKLEIAFIPTAASALHGSFADQEGNDYIVNGGGFVLVPLELTKSLHSCIGGRVSTGGGDARIRCDGETLKVDFPSGEKAVIKIGRE